MQVITRCPGRMVALPLGAEETVGGLAARLGRVQGAQVVQPLQVQAKFSIAWSSSIQLGAVLYS